MVVIEYKTMAYPYHYVFLGKNEEGEIATFKTKTEARKKAMSLIRTHVAIVAYLHPNELVYRTKEGTYVLEKRIMIDGRERSFWYVLRKDGTLGKHISDIRDWHLIQSAY